jgi:hypothetical protein
MEFAVHAAVKVGIAVRTYILSPDFSSDVFNFFIK